MSLCDLFRRADSGGLGVKKSGRGVNKTPFVISQILVWLFTLESCYFEDVADLAYSFTGMCTMDEMPKIF